MINHKELRSNLSPEFYKEFKTKYYQTHGNTQTINNIKTFMEDNYDIIMAVYIFNLKNASINDPEDVTPIIHMNFIQFAEQKFFIYQANKQDILNPTNVEMEINKLINDTYNN